MPVSSCPACLSRHFREAFVCEGFPIARCQQCSHQFVAIEVPEKVLAAAYGADYYGGAKKTADVKGYSDYMGNMSERLAVFGNRMATIVEHAKTSGRLLDYGCAIGLFLKVAVESGWHAVGYERSEWAVTCGRERLGVDIRLASPGENAFGAEEFDAVTLWDVAEHLAKPRDVVTQAHEWLRPNGLLVLNTVNSSSLGARLAGRAWRHLAPPWHLQYFTKKSLTRMLYEVGFEIVKSTGEGTVIEGAGRPTWLGAGLVERSFQHWRFRGIASTLNLLDEIMVVARRKQTGRKVEG